MTKVPKQFTAKFAHKISAATILMLLAVFVVSSVVLPNSVTAQFSVPGSGAGQVPVNDTTQHTLTTNGNFTLGGIQSSIGSNDPTNPQNAANLLNTIKDDVAKQIGQTCKTVLAANSLTEVDGLLSKLDSTNINLINGDPFVASFTTAQAKVLAKAAQCAKEYVNILRKTDGSNLIVAAAVQREQGTWSELANSLDKQAKDLEARATASWQDVLKAFMVKTILNVNKTLTTELVNKMISKYKISDYLSYGDALASQVYSMKYIDQNYTGNVETQLMIRSLMQSDKLPEKIKTVQTMANTQAQQYIGTVCPAGSQDNTMYYINCIAGLGSPQANSDWIMSNAIDAKNAAVGAGKVMAAQEISQSNGYAPPRNCSGSLAQQQQIDSQLDVANTALQNARAISARLISSKNAGISVSDADLATAAAAEKKANQDVADLMNKFRAGGQVGPDGKPVIDPVTGKVKTGAIIDICESIASPANFVATSLGDFLKSHLDQSSQLKSDNLPFYLNFLSDVASNFLTNILTGGKSTSQVLKEAGVGALNGTLIGVATAAQSSGGSPVSGSTINNNANDVLVVAVPANGAQGGTTLTTGADYRFAIDLSASPDLLNVVSAKISGFSGGATSIAINPSTHKGTTPLFTAGNPGNFTITLDFYDSSNSTSLKTISKTFTNVKPGGVAGAVTTIPSEEFLPRGPVQDLR